MQDELDALGALVGGWRFESPTGGTDGLFRAADAFGHCGFRYQEGGRYLRRGEAANGPQGERDL